MLKFCQMDLDMRGIFSMEKNKVEEYCFFLVDRGMKVSKITKKKITGDFNHNDISGEGTFYW